MRNFLLPFALLLVLPVRSQDSDAKKFAVTINPKNLRQHLEVVAGKATEGRETASAGERRAAAYIQEQFVKMGLKPGNGSQYLMPFTVYKDTVSKAVLNVNGNTYRLGTDFGAWPDMDHNTELRFSEAVFAGYGISSKTYDEYKTLDVAGKLVVIYDGEPSRNGKYLATGAKEKTKWSHALLKADVATRNGATAVLIVTKNFPHKDQSSVSDVYIDPYRSYIPANTFFITEKVAADILGKKFSEIKESLQKDTLPKFEYVSTKIDMGYTHTTQTLTSNNVLGVLEGSDKKDEYVFLTAHYDHLGKRGNDIYYGADDDGSGTVSVLQLAQAFVNAKKAGKGPRRSIVFMLVSGEEKGLWGSDYYTSHPIYPLEKTTVDLNIDMIGRTGFEYDKSKDSANYVYVIGDDKLSSDLRPISERNNKGTKLKLDYKYNDLNDPNYFYYRSDHYNFAKKGVPIIFYTDGEHKDYHKPSDTVDRINFELLTQRARLVFYTAWEMANMDRMLKRDIPLK